MGFLLKPKANLEIPLEADIIRPDLFAELSLDEIKNLLVYEGKTKKFLREFFDIDETPHEDHIIIIDGDISNVKYVGSKMKFGKIIINGNVGLQLGSEMEGGEIEVNGNASSWIGMEMKGGTIKIKGNAGDYVGCAYRGEWRGMHNGNIIIEGNAGDNIGGGMLNGKIHIKGNAGNFCGIRMNGGAITVNGDVGRVPGAEMISGTIKIYGKIKSFPPGFKHISTQKIKKELLMIFKGDISENKADGRLYVSYKNNIHLFSDPPAFDDEIITEKGLRVIYNSGSTIHQGQIIKGGNKLTEDYKEECARCHINPDDYRLLHEPKKVIVSSQKNEVVLMAVEDPTVQKGTIFIPRGIWANVITPPLTESTGSPLYKGVYVYLKRANENAAVMDAKELTEK